MIEGIRGGCTRRDSVIGKGAMYHQSSGKPVSVFNALFVGKPVK